MRHAKGVHQHDEAATLFRTRGRSGGARSLSYDRERDVTMLGTLEGSSLHQYKLTRNSTRRKTHLPTMSQYSRNCHRCRRWSRARIWLETARACPNTQGLDVVCKSTDRERQPESRPNAPCSRSKSGVCENRNHNSMIGLIDGKMKEIDSFVGRFR